MTFTPKKSGNYDISVKAKDASGTVVKKTFAINVIMFGVKNFDK